MLAPVPTLMGAAAMATVDTDNDGNPFNNIADFFSNDDLTDEQKAENMRRHQEFVQPNKDRRSDNKEDERHLSEVEELVTDEEVAASDSATADTDLSDLKFTINGDGTLPLITFTPDGKSRCNLRWSAQTFRLYFGDKFQNDAYVKQKSQKCCYANGCYLTVFDARRP